MSGRRKPCRRTIENEELSLQGLRYKSVEFLKFKYLGRPLLGSEVVVRGARDRRRKAGNGGHWAAAVSCADGGDGDDGGELVSYGWR